MKKAPQNLKIRQATEQDVPLLLSLVRALADYEKRTYEMVATEESLREGFFGARRVAEAALAFLDDEPVGIAVFFHNFSTFLGCSGIYLEDLFVNEEVRGRGIGSALFAHVAKLATERGCGKFEWAVLDWNEPAIAFYRSLGAVPLSDWRIQRLSGDALMKLANEG